MHITISVTGLEWSSSGSRMLWSPDSQNFNRNECDADDYNAILQLSKRIRRDVDGMLDVSTLDEMLRLYFACMFCEH